MASLVALRGAPLSIPCGNTHDERERSAHAHPVYLTTDVVILAEARAIASIDVVDEDLLAEGEAQGLVHRGEHLIAPTMLGVWYSSQSSN